MHESRMIADVGCIENVSGSRMATPFGPPKPGSTPTMTPISMPTSIRPTLYQVSTTPKPFSSSLNSSKVEYPEQAKRATVARAGVHAGQAQAQYPNHCSSGPLGSGTVNWYSKSQKMTALMTTGTTMLLVQP